MPIGEHSPWWTPISPVVAGQLAEAIKRGIQTAKKKLAEQLASKSTKG